MIIIHARFHVDSAKQQAFLNEIHSLISDSRKENGNVSYDLYKDTEKEDVYTMVELWKNTEAVANHNKSKHFTSFVDKANQFLTAPLDITAFDGQPLQGK
ncbi:putative quinol monooxygenase [Bacillus sp. BP-3]|uniref:putative quinol monooxygenase n=1 Tax=Bacillus sp. BP-3 TaxID=3022773 RepID=UPI00232AC3CF|nr:putative quinol monooxygenase [Bacillus sp. BP-3]MDC2865365.1 putative quinol monooxygenase [Bacillus sp. BP-3]